MENLIPNIKNIASSLYKTVEESENNFISLGTYLQDLSADIADLSSQTNEAAGLYQGQDENIFDNIKGSTGKIVDKLKRTGSKIEKTLVPFESVIELMNRLKNENQQIEEYAKYLRSLAFNFVIESAVLSESDDNFGIISTEVKELSAKISETSKRIKTDTEKYLDSFNSSHKNITGEMNEMDSLTVDSEELIKNSLNETEILLNQSLNTIEAVNTGSKSVNREIGKIIMAVQLHDSISQRIEHINLGLEDVSKLLGSDEAVGGIDFEKDKREPIAGAILKVQCSQLGNIVGDLEKVYRDNLDSFMEIVNDIDRLTDSISELGLDTSKGSVVGNLLVSLERLNKIRIKSNSISENIFNISKESSETATSMYEHSRVVKNIGDETHTKALNSIIASEKLGLEGVTVKVLSQEMGLISMDIRRFVNSVEEVLTEINQNASELSGDKENEEQSDNDDDEIGMIIEFLNETSLKIETDLKYTLESCNSVKDSMKKSMENLNFIKNMTVDFSAILKDLSELYGNFNLDDVDVSDFFSNNYFIKRYTMEKERQIHNDTLPADSKSKKAPDENENTDEDYLGDNVDLF